jgi:hypothetical protein
MGDLDVHDVFQCLLYDTAFCLRPQALPKEHVAILCQLLVGDSPSIGPFEEVAWCDEAMFASKYIATLWQDRLSHPI